MEHSFIVQHLFNIGLPQNTINKAVYAIFYERLSEEYFALFSNLIMFKTIEVLMVSLLRNTWHTKNCVV